MQQQAKSYWVFQKHDKFDYILLRSTLWESQQNSSTRLVFASDRFLAADLSATKRHGLMHSLAWQIFGRHVGHVSLNSINQVGLNLWLSSVLAAFVFHDAETLRSTTKPLLLNISLTCTNWRGTVHAKAWRQLWVCLCCLLCLTSSKICFALKIYFLPGIE